MQMNSVKYEDFLSSSRAGNGGGGLCDQADEIELALARARRTAHEAGFEAGKNSAQAEFDNTLTALLVNIESAVAQMQAVVSNNESAARAAAFQLTRSFIQAVAPRLASSALAPEICAAIEDALKDEPHAKFVVEVATERREEIENVIASSAANGSVEANKDLGSTEARVYWEGGFDQIDPEQTIAKALQLLDARLTKKLPDQALGPDHANEVQE